MARDHPKMARDYMETTKNGPYLHENMYFMGYMGYIGGIPNIYAPHAKTGRSLTKKKSSPPLFEGAGEAENGQHASFYVENVKKHVFGPFWYGVHGF